MSNANEQRKGGFGAFVERENERAKVAERARVLAARPGSTHIFDRPILVTEDEPRTATTAGAKRADKTADYPAPAKVARG